MKSISLFSKKYSLEIARMSLTSKFLECFWSSYPQSNFVKFNYIPFYSFFHFLIQPSHYSALVFSYVPCTRRLFLIHHHRELMPLEMQLPALIDIFITQELTVGPWGQGMIQICVWEEGIWELNCLSWVEVHRKEFNILENTLYFVLSILTLSDFHFPLMTTSTLKSGFHTCQ